MINLPRAAAVLVLVLAASLACGRPATTQAQALPIGGCPIFPANNIWNTPIDTLPVDANSAAYVNSIGATAPFHPDFGSDPSYGIPYNVVPASQAGLNLTFQYDEDSDHQPYPIPNGVKIEAGSDRHILIVQQGSCKLYELFDAQKQTNGSWHAGSGAIFDLQGNSLRTDGYTSADAAGLPILPGLVRRDEVLAGAINHALRFTAAQTRKSHIWPARHDASDDSSPSLPPMGQRFRLKASFNISSYPAYAQVILKALKKYGMILADNGSNWYVSGTNDTNWDDDALNTLKQLRGSDFEAVDESSLQLGADSAQAKQLAQDGQSVVPAAVRQGEQAVFTIQIVGDGQAVSLSDSLPAGLTLVAGPTTTPATVPPASATGQSIAWGGTPPEATIVQISYTVRVDTPATATLANTATVLRGDVTKTLTALLIANPLRGFLPVARR